MKDTKAMLNTVWGHLAAASNACDDLVDDIGDSVDDIDEVSALVKAIGAALQAVRDAVDAHDRDRELMR